MNNKNTLLEVFDELPDLEVSNEWNTKLWQQIQCPRQTKERDISSRLIIFGLALLVGVNIASITSMLIPKLKSIKNNKKTHNQLKHKKK